MVIFITLPGYEHLEICVIFINIYLFIYFLDVTFHQVQPPPILVDLLH